MKSTIILIIVSVLSVSCVQETKTQKVSLLLNVYGLKNIENIGVRGGDSPLSWENDLSLRPIVKDSLYQADVTYQTGYKVAEIKFTVNGNFELQNQPNRIIRFDKSGRTTASFVFNTP